MDSQEVLPTQILNRRHILERQMHGIQRHAQGDKAKTSS